MLKRLGYLSLWGILCPEMSCRQEPPLSSPGLVSKSGRWLRVLTRSLAPDGHLLVISGLWEVPTLVHKVIN